MRTDRMAFLSKGASMIGALLVLCFTIVSPTEASAQQCSPGAVGISDVSSTGVWKAYGAASTGDCWGVSLTRGFNMPASTARLAATRPTADSASA
jgi:hypothetical protein